MSIESDIYNNNLTYIKEYHFHIYFNHLDEIEICNAKKLRDTILLNIKNRVFIVILNSITNDILPKSIDLSKLPKFNTSPIGPHPTGSYEVWVPIEYYTIFLSFILLNRNNLSVLIHPLTREELLDHTDRAVWLGKKYDLKLERLEEILDKLPIQYPELELGYSSI